MKKILRLLAAMVISTNIYAQTTAVDYLNTVGQQFTNISNEMMSYVSAVNHGKSARKIEKRRQEFMGQVKESETIVRRLRPFEGKTALRDSIAAYFKLTRIILNEDYGKILNLEEIA